MFPGSICQRRRSTSGRAACLERTLKVLGQDMSATKSAAGARSRGGILADAAFLSQLNDLSDLARMSSEQLPHRLVLARRIGTTVLGQLAELKRPIRTSKAARTLL
jgi:hypothetical protein